jgi:hypothetical protein
MSTHYTRTWRYTPYSRQHALLIGKHCNRIHYTQYTLYTTHIVQAGSAAGKGSSAALSPAEAALLKEEEAIRSKLRGLQRAAVAALTAAYTDCPALGAASMAQALPLLLQGTAAHFIASL